MPRRSRVEAYVPDVPCLPDTVTPSRETRRARFRAEYGARVNTNANRKNGGGATWGRVSAEYLAGTQRVNPPTSSGVKDVSPADRNYFTPPNRQHMLTVTDEDTYLRNRARAIADRRSLTEYR